MDLVAFVGKERAHEFRVGEHAPGVVGGGVQLDDDTLAHERCGVLLLPGGEWPDAVGDPGLQRFPEVVDSEAPRERAADDRGSRDGEDVAREPELVHDGDGALLHERPVDNRVFLFDEGPAEGLRLFEPARDEHHRFLPLDGGFHHAFEAGPF